MTPPIRAFVQARMTSSRFPGKVLAPFRGVPLVRHVVRAVEGALPDVPVVVATSDQRSDDPLVRYLEAAGVTVFRGSLDHVFDRFRRCAERWPCEWILRVSGDSPLLDPRVLRAVTGHAGDAALDLVTTISPRTFPRGQNAELIRARTLLAIDPAELTAHDQEHVTPFFYRHAERFDILNVRSGDPALADLHLAVDTMDDLRRLEAMPASAIARLALDGETVSLG